MPIHRQVFGHLEQYNLVILITCTAVLQFLDQLPQMQRNGTSNPTDKNMDIPNYLALI